MIYLVVKILPCDLGSGGSSGQPGTARWPVGRPADCVFWPAGGGAEAAAGGPGASPAATAAGGEGYSANFKEDTHYREVPELKLQLPDFYAKVCKEENSVPKSEFRHKLYELGK